MAFRRASSSRSWPRPSSNSGVPAPSASSFASASSWLVERTRENASRRSATSTDRSKPSPTSVARTASSPRLSSLSSSRSTASWRSPSMPWPSKKPRSNLRRSEEHTSELQSLMRISYAVFCLKKKKKNKYHKKVNEDKTSEMKANNHAYNI